MFAFLVAARFVDPIVSLPPYQFARDRFCSRLWYVEFQNKYRKEGLTAIGVSMDDDGWKSVKPFLEEHKLNYPVVIAKQDLANRYGGLPSLPMTLLIDRNGKIAESHAGMVDRDAFENKIKALLHESPAK